MLGLSSCAPDFSRGGTVPSPPHKPPLATLHGNMFLSVLYDIFPRATFQVPTSQMFNFPSVNFPKVRIGPLRRCRLQWGRALRLGWPRGQTLWLRGRTMRLGRTWEASCCLGNFTFGKLPLGEIPYNTLQVEEPEIHKMVEIQDTGMVSYLEQFKFISEWRLPPFRDNMVNKILKNSMKFIKV